MQKSASAPSGSFPANASSSVSASGSISLVGVDREKLPIGVSRLVASRMRLDATLAPSMLELRMNTRNLVNEMKYNGGKIVSHQFALMRPRRNTKWEKPKDIKEQSIRDKELRRLQKKVSRSLTLKKKQEALDAEEASHKELLEKSPKSVSSKAIPGTSHHKVVEEQSPKAVELLDDPSLDAEVHRLSQDPRIEQVWRMMQQQGVPESVGEELPTGLPRKRVERALEALGHPASEDKETVEEALASLPGDKPLELNEFISVVAVFNRQRRVHLKEHFQRLDEDSSGTVNIREFRHLLWDLGFTVTHETVVEYLREVDDDHSGEVEYEEFEHACHLVHQRHGFSKAEVLEFEDLFDRYDADASNEMEADELASAMGWFGSPCTLDQAREIIYRYDDDHNGCIAKPEFLMIMRQHLEDEISEMRSLFHDFDTDESGTMDGEELLSLFLKCGYTITSDVVEDAMRSALPNIKNAKSVELIFEDVLKVFYLVRKREGFSEKELNELTDIYERHDKGGKGELREFELARCFNWMGYPLSQQRRRELWCRVDVDKTESIELGEFLKLVRLLREEEVESAREVLDSCQHLKGSNKSNLPESVLKNMLIKLGYGPPPNIISEAMQQPGDSSGDGAVDLWGVLGILRFIREKQVAKLRASAGISDQQAQKIKGKFGMRIEKGKKVEADEFEKLMFDFFPVARHLPGEKEKIRAIIVEQCGGTAIKDLMEACWVVRLYGDMRDEDKWTRETHAAEEAGFTLWQVSSFREAFVAADTNADGCLSMRETQQVFEDLMSLNLNQFEAMNREFNSLGDKKDMVEFCEFLRLMRVVLRGGR